MKIILLPSATSRGEEHIQFVTSFLINDTIALDAGSLGFYATVQDQARVKHIMLSHSHLDRVANYILNEEMHHRRKSFQEEYVEFLERHHVPHDQRYIFKPIQ